MPIPLAALLAESADKVTSTSENYVEPGRPAPDEDDEPAGDGEQAAAAIAAFAGCVRGGMTERLRREEEVLIYGAGAWLSRARPVIPGGLPRPLVLADPRLLGNREVGAAVPAYEHPALIRHIEELTGGSSPPVDLVAVSADMPREHFAEAATARSGAGHRGVFGAAVTLNGVPGILTAGHVAAHDATRPVSRGDGHLMWDGDGAPAPIVFATHAGTVHGQELTADVAVVELRAPAGRAQQFSGGGVPFIDDLLTRIGGTPTGQTPMPYRAFCAWVRVEGRMGLWGETYLTELPLGLNGDSGSPVVGSRGRLVGHYLGGSSANGFVQQLDYQLPEGCGLP